MAFSTAAADFSTAANVITSIPFLLVGIVGLWWIAFSRSTIISYAGIPFVSFVLSLFMVGTGSIVYHLYPSSYHLLWDRLPIAICLASFTCALLNLQRASRKGTALLLPALLVAVSSVLYWYGKQDLRPYAVVQVSAAVFAGGFAFMRPISAVGIGNLRAAILCYGGGRIAELFQQQVYDRFGADFAHPLKHVLVAVAALLMLRGVHSAMKERKNVLPRSFRPAEPEFI